ncbi:MAG: hypothetical protein KGJ39_00595 [Acidobacteriota bacterium]|nr:hypothetical protein [Acidobacteriota bacterium]
MSTFAGLWDVTLSTPIGKMAVVLDIAEHDGAIRGTAATSDEQVDFIDPIATGNQLTWTQNVTTPMKLTLKFDVTVDGDEMSGGAKAGPLPASTLSGRRRAS